MHLRYIGHIDYTDVHVQVKSDTCCTLIVPCFARAGHIWYLVQEVNTNYKLSHNSFTNVIVISCDRKLTGLVLNSVEFSEI